MDSTDNNLTDPVARQYEQWTYPAPSDDLPAAVDAPGAPYRLLRGRFWVYWPADEPREDWDLLVAGCGTMAAACYAYLYPRARVYGIDVSAASLAHEEKLAGKYSLKNLTLRQCRVEDVAELSREFDVIYLPGVLQHLADPVAGLRALGQTLRPDGILGAMVYAPYGRAGVDVLQRLFRLLGLKQTPSDVQIVKNTLAALGPEHPATRYLHAACDLDTDIGLADTFLHPRERTFSVGECLDLVAQAGLAVGSFEDLPRYYPSAVVSGRGPLTALLERLSDKQLWQATELLDGTMAAHQFWACRSERLEREYKIQFDDEAFLEFSPCTAESVATLAADLPALDAAQNGLLEKVDGKRTILSCMHASGLPPNAAGVELARQLFRTLWRQGRIFFRLAKNA